MTLLTLVKYLVGSREAILQVARSPGALWVGLLFVLAAGFAREYDGEDLLAEPWHLLIPLGASVVSSAVLYLLVQIVAWFRHEPEPPLARGYATFLSLYWMTAPLALVYAIPFERFLSAGEATRANLWLLALVAAWRVLLISRVVSVLYTTSYIAAFVVVMLFADSLMLLILRFTPLPIFVSMGGLRYSDSDIVLQLAALFSGALGVVTWPIWAVGTLAVIIWGARWRYEASVDERGQAPAYPVWIAAAMSLAVWLIVMPFTQPEQRLRRQVERDLVAGRIGGALATMSAHEPGDFPPHWDPPPRITYQDRLPDIVVVQELALDLELKPWVRAVFDEKFTNSLGGLSHYEGIWPQLSPKEVERRLVLLRRLPDHKEAVTDLSPGLELLATRPDITSRSKALVAELLAEIRPSPTNGETTERGEPESEPVDPLWAD